MRHLTFITALQLIIACFLPFALAARAKNLVVFGDSYADVGNFHRWTNGPLWSENVAVGWDASLYSFAYSGASCDNALFQNTSEADPIPSVKDQIEMFYNLQLDLDPSETVFAIWVGMNDIQKLQLENKEATPDVRQVAACISEQIRNIRKVFRANYIMVFNVPPLEHMPFFADGHAPLEKEAWGASAAKLNALLQKDVVNLNKYHHALELDLIDVHRLFTDIVANPSMFGFTDSTSAYLDTCQGKCDNVNDYVWWDRTHVTGGVHLVIANSILLAGSFAPVTSIDPARVNVQLLLEDHNSPYRSPVYVAPPNTGLIERLVAEMVTTTTPKRYSLDDQDDDYEPSWFWNHGFVMCALFLTVIVGTSAWKKRHPSIKSDGSLGTASAKSRYYVPLYSVSMSEK